MSTEFFWTAVALVTVLSAARLTRLAVADDFPPIKWLRDKAYDYLDKNAERRKWQIITYCGYCASFWFTLPLVLWVYFAVHYGSDAWLTAWWIFNGAFAGAYVASIVVRFDGDDSGDE